MIEPSACTISVGSTDDQSGFEPAVTITVTGSDLADLDDGVEPEAASMVRPRRSRQNRSTRARAAQRLAIRTGQIADPRRFPPMTIKLGGRP